jgi:hypothetical protein
MIDKRSTGAFVFGIMLYTTVVIPGVRTVANPLDVDTREDQVEALRVLAAGNTLIVVCLGLALALQVRSLLFPHSLAIITFE